MATLETVQNKLLNIKNIKQKVTDILNEKAELRVDANLITLPNLANEITSHLFYPVKIFPNANSAFISRKLGCDKEGAIFPWEINIDGKGRTINKNWFGHQESFMNVLSIYNGKISIKNLTFESVANNPSFATQRLCINDCVFYGYSSLPQWWPNWGNTKDYPDSNPKLIEYNLSGTKFDDPNKPVGLFSVYQAYDDPWEAGSVRGYKYTDQMELYKPGLFHVSSMNKTLNNLMCKIVDLSEINMDICTEMDMTFENAIIDKVIFPKDSPETAATQITTFNPFKGAKIKSIENFEVIHLTPTDLSHKFEGATIGYGLNFKNWDTSKVTTMNSMFKDFSSDYILDITSFDTSACTDITDMFKNCSANSVKFPENFASNDAITVLDLRNCSFPDNDFIRDYTYGLAYRVADKSSSPKQHYVYVPKKYRPLYGASMEFSSKGWTVQYY